MRLRSAALICLVLLVTAIAFGCDSKKVKPRAEVGKTKLDPAKKREEAIVEKAEDHADVAAGAIITAFNAIDELMNSLDDSEPPDPRLVATVMRDSIKTARNEIAAAHATIESLPESAGLSDYIAALEEQFNASNHLEGMAAILDNEGGITTKALQESDEKVVSMIFDLRTKFDNSTENADKLHKEALEELGFSVDKGKGRGKDKVKVKTKEGEFEAGENKLPDGFPDKFPIYEDAKVVSGTKMTVEQGTSFSVQLDVDDPVSKVSDYYKEALPDAGYKIEDTIETDGSVMYTMEGDGLVQVMNQDGKTKIKITLVDMKE